MNDLEKKALASLPHGPEFRFLDRVMHLEPGKKGDAEYTLRGNEPFLRGHFPGQPLMPGVLLVEAAAQLAGVVAQCDAAIPPLARLKLTAIRGVKILGTAAPGQTIYFRAEITARMENLIQARAEASVGGSKILIAEVTLSGEAPSR